MDIRISVIAAVTLLISLSEGTCNSLCQFLTFSIPTSIFVLCIEFFFHIKKLRWFQQKQDISAMIHQCMAHAQKLLQNIPCKTFWWICAGETIVSDMRVADTLYVFWWSSVFYFKAWKKICQLCRQINCIIDNV